MSHEHKDALRRGAYSAGNRLIAVTFCVPAIPFMWLAGDSGFAWRTAKVICTGRGKP